MENITKDTLKLLDELVELIDNSSNVPFSKKIAIDKEEILEIVRDIKIGLPNQLKQADWVHKQQDHILETAKADAQSLIEKTQAYAQEKINEHEITRIAKENARVIQEEATLTSEQIKEGARNYAIEMLTKVNENIDKLNTIIGNNIKELEEYDL